MVKNSILTFVAICFCLLHASIFAQVKTYTTNKITGDAPIIDERSTDAAWNKVDWGGDFVQWVPEEGEAPSQKAASVKGDEYVSNDGDSWDEGWDPIWYGKSSIDDL